MLFPDKKKVEMIRRMYPPGTRIRLKEMQGENLSEGLMGIVDMVDDIGQIHMSWDNGSSLALNVDLDNFTKVG